MGNVTGRLLYKLLEFPKSAATTREKSSAREHEINLPELPESCIAAILSFTTPRDVCRLSAVSTLFRSAANDDSIWSKFIPQQSYQILPRAVTPVAYASRRELYFRLCDSVLIDGGTQIFWLERSTGKIGYMLSATELSIAWGNDQRYWNWPASGDDSRFGVLAELKSVWWFHVWGQFDCRLLSENTQYRVVFVLKFAEDSYGWSGLPISFSVTGPDEPERVSSRVFIRQRAHRDPNDNADSIFYEYGQRLEVVAGEFTVTANENDGAQNESSCQFSMREVKNAKGGLFLDGVRIEPVR